MVFFFTSFEVCRFVHALLEILCAKLCMLLNFFGFREGDTCHPWKELDVLVMEKRQILL